MNPFSLSFGKEPVKAISREKQINEIIDGFTADNPEFHVCMITGVRGSGKTVFMTEICSNIKQNDDWIVVELSTERDILNALAAELSSRKELLQIFRDAKINLSIFGLSLEIDSEPPITDVVVAVDRMLNQLSKKGKKVLIALDEAVSNKYVREFTSQIQIYMRKEYNIFLIMTGLYENIYELQNEETLTFLYRAPKFEMEPLNSTLVARQYQSIFNISSQEAEEMAELVMGYPYAYQVLGYLCYKQGKKYKEVIDDLDIYLGEYVYEKIWSELSNKDREVLKAISNCESTKIEDIRNKANISSNYFNVYRNRLIKKGLIKSIMYGHVALSLPRFKEFVLNKG